MSFSSRPISGVTLFGVTRGGGSESVEWGRNGPFRMIRSYSVFRPGFPQSDYYAGGAVYCTVPTIPSGAPDSDSKVKSDGDIAIGRARPSSPSVNLLTSAGELAADGLPSPPDLIRWRRSLGDLLKLGKDLSKDYVAYNFAWKPLEAEIRGYYRNVVTADQIVRDSQKANNAGIIRVGYTHPTRESETSLAVNVTSVGWASGSSTGNQAPGGQSTRTFTKTWFEGKYLYFHPVPKDVGNASHDFANYAKHVLGLQLTPEVLWNLSPWSWFSDWLTNTDIAIGALSSAASDGMVPVSSFVMSHHYREAHKFAHSSHMSGDGKIARFSPTAAKRVVEYKLRFPSIPYLGFGGGVSELTPKQISILAALGISRA